MYVTNLPVVGILGVCDDPSCGSNLRCLWRALLSPGCVSLYVTAIILDGFCLEWFANFAFYCDIREETCGSNSQCMWRALVFPLRPHNTQLNRNLSGQFLPQLVCELYILLWHCDNWKRSTIQVEVEGDMTRTRSEFENELNKNKVQFARGGDRNVNFILCQFQRFVLYWQKIWN